MRSKGLSYSQIKEKVNVSKSTLSSWLKTFPLPEQAIRALRGNNPKRIERFRNTMRRKRENEEALMLLRVGEDLSVLSVRDKLIAGLFLYWGEGTKAAAYTTAITNTDPDMIKFFIDWLALFNIRRDQLSVVLHLYSDMNPEYEIDFWSSCLDIKKEQFRKPSIKKTQLCDITYTTGFRHGTCSVLYYDKELYLYTKMALKHLRMHA